MELDCSLARLVPHSEYFAGVPPPPRPDQVVRTSRFAYLRFERELVLSSPRAHAHLVVLGMDALRLYHALCRGASPAGLIREFASEIPPVEIERFLQLLLAGAIVEPVLPDAPELTAEDADDALRQWQFHDLLLQAESRLGRNREPLGGTYRFIAELPPAPAVKQSSWGRAVIELAAPAADHYSTAVLAQVIEQRRTLRTQGARPITLRELGDFLHRTSRVISRQSTPWAREYPFGGEYTRRPYPNGGSRYELEIYVTTNRCDGLDRGLYYYEPLHHRLAAVSGPVPDMEQLLGDAARASGGADTQVLLTITSRFQRCSWKYQGLALALQLKNLGVLFAHMYLVATAMQLAPCALGAGDSDRFSRLAKLEYAVETSIGEFMLGTRPADESS